MIFNPKVDIGSMRVKLGLVPDYEDESIKRLLVTTMIYQLHKLIRFSSTSFNF